jgi:hypothetical protein
MFVNIGSGVKCFHCIHVFDLTNLKGEKRRNLGKLNNELNIVNQLVDLHFLLFVNGYFDVVLKTKSIMDKLCYLLKLGI